MSVSSSKPFLAVFAWFISACLLCIGASEASAATTNSKHPIVHKVQRGQTLGMISHRWNIPLGGLCTANGINRKKPIHPGQELIIPALDDPEGKAAAKLRSRGFLDEKQRPKLLEEIEKAERAEREKAEAAEKAKREKEERAHKAERAKAERAKRAERQKAERAKRAEREKQQRKRKLARKERSQRKSTRSRTQRASRAKSTKQKVAKNKPTRRRGYVRIKGLMGSWHGYAIDQKGNVTEAAKAGFRKVLRSWRTGAGADIEPRLIRMVAEVSDHFGGKQILVISGYRPKRKAQFTPHSRHNFGQAMDFHIEGVKNEELRDYARKFNKAGVGYYPNSSFIHL
ncbi:MAG: DUF882 domain-containing protein, partial [Myxococcales bacterium]|nr:DUF882 domain-containing protein [Myxococcales bacterium]